LYKIKQIPLDFVVKEISKVKAEDKGNYAYFLLKKENWNTLDVVKEISKRLNVPLKEIGFAGNKDKKAVTEQVISIKRVKKERVIGLKLKDVSLEFLGYGEERINLGDLEGNYFEIVVRNLDKVEFEVKDKFVNYFDGQRFGRNNIGVGRNLVKKDFKEAVKLIGDGKVDSYLKKNKNDFIGALKLIPIRLLRLYVNAYQSYLWNEMVKEVIKGIKVKEVPLVGFGTELEGERGEIIEKVLEKENVSLEDFIIRQIPQLSLEGGSRNVFVEVNDFNVLEKGEDELNKGKKKIKICFSLPKGSYATMFLKNLF